jgi:tRNA (guanine37-N1)-methyltransferase
MLIDILSLFPDYFKGPFDVSILKRAIENKIIEIRYSDIRNFSQDRHKKVDDRPFGGGPGMVLSPKPVCDAIRSVKGERSHVIYLSAQGCKFDSKKAQELAKKEHLILVCGHYEGIDERALKEVDEEISIGDYVLTNGCIAAIVLIDATVRFIQGVIGHPEAAQKDSFNDVIFEGPNFTRPIDFEGAFVPPILLGGNHAEIEKYKLEQALTKTKRVRPDLYEKYLQEKMLMSTKD